MKSSRSNHSYENTISAEADLREEVVEPTPSSEATPVKSRGFRAALRRFKQDLRAPLPGTEELTRWGKIKARFRHLVKRYGWKLVVAIIVYYLIRDSILYIIIPYLIASHLID